MLSLSEKSIFCSVSLVIALLLPWVSVSAEEGGILEGPCLTERTKLKARIQKLGESGVGIKPYQDAFAGIEESVAAKESDAAILKSVERLNGSLNEQMENKKAIVQNSYYHVYKNPNERATPAVLQSAMQQNHGTKLPAGLTPEMLMKYVNSNPEAKKKFEDFQKGGH